MRGVGVVFNFSVSFKVEHFALIDFFQSGTEPFLCPTECLAQAGGAPTNERREMMAKPAAGHDMGQVL